MNLTPQMRAYGAMLGMALLFGLVTLMYGQWLVERRTYVFALWFAGFVASFGAYLWVHRRYAPNLPAEVASPAHRTELILAVERMPKVVWLAVAPPLLVAAMLGWITTHGSELPWRYGWQGSVASRPEYLKMLLNVVLFNGWSLLLLGSGVLVWFGTSRAYEFRREFLGDAVAWQWLVLVPTVDHLFWTGFRVPVAVATASHTANALVSCYLILMVLRARKLHSAAPEIGKSFYFDPGNPAFLGPRGLNLACRWFWGLSGAGVALLVLAIWNHYGLQAGS